MDKITTGDRNKYIKGVIWDLKNHMQYFKFYGDYDIVEIEEFSTLGAEAWVKFTVNETYAKCELVNHRPVEGFPRKVFQTVEYWFKFEDGRWKIADSIADTYNHEDIDAKSC